MPTPSSHVETVREIEFAEGLALLQELIGEEVIVLVDFCGTSGAAILRGRLSRVRTLPPDNGAVDIFLDDRQSLMLDPIDTEVLSIDEGEGGKRWVEFHLPSGVVASIEPAEPPRDRHKCE